MSNQTFSACPGKANLPLNRVNATWVVASVSSDSTAHIIGHLVSSVDTSAAICFVNGTQTTNAQTAARNRVANTVDLLVPNSVVDFWSRTFDSLSQSNAIDSTDSTRLTHFVLCQQ